MTTDMLGFVVGMDASVGGTGMEREGWDGDFFYYYYNYF